MLVRLKGQTNRMITQIEIDGFKTFLDFKVELAPFQVLVGANAAGKSNLFDAFHLPSVIKAPSFLTPEGHNLLAMLVRLQAEDKQALIAISRDMANIVPGFHLTGLRKPLVFSSGVSKPFLLGHDGLGTPLDTNVIE